MNAVLRLERAICSSRGGAANADSGERPNTIWLIARYLAIGLLYVAGYAALDRISFIHAWSIFGFTLWNPPPALSLALVVTGGPAYIPFILVAGLTVEILVRDAQLGTQAAVASALILASGYGCLGILLRRAGPIDLLRGSMRDVVILLLLVPLGVLLVASAFVAGFALFGFFLPQDYFRAVSSFWIGDVTGILALLPVLLIAFDSEGRWRQRLQGAALDFIIFAGLLCGSIWLIFIAGFVNELRFFYLLFIPVIWIAVRRGITGASIGVLTVQASVALAVLIRSYPSGTFLSFQMFFLIIAATGLLLGAVVTARYQAELRLRSQQAEIDRVARMTTVGVMGSALAHQISQPLASIATYAHAAELLLTKAPAPDRVRNVLSEIAIEAERVGHILRQLRDFIADGRIERGPTDVAEIVQKVVTLVRRQNASSNIAIIANLGAVPTVMADAVQMEQVLLNVINNAVEAILSSQDVGTVSVTTRSSAEFVEVLVDDEGPGIEPELADRLFEPFVTSKSYGMGLGLAICYAIMQAHHGLIEHTGRAPKGTRCIIRLPIDRKGNERAKSNLRCRR